MEALLVAQKQNDARLNMVTDMLLAGRMCDVQPDKLDIVLVPAEVLNNATLERDSVTVLHLEKLVQMGSEATLLGDEIRVEMDDMEPATENEGENLCPEGSTSDEKVWWFTSQEAALQCSGVAAELADPDMGVSPTDTILASQSDKDEQQVTVTAAEICAEEVTPVCDAVEEQYMYSLYSDATVVASEVGWWMTHQAVVHGSDFAVELLMDSSWQGENGMNPLPVVARNARSVSSGSSGKARGKRVYRPPAKGISPRLTQEQINFISLQRVKK
ncbi:hypothetical protein HDU80_008301 [Chytriomyces hyalinus]|nr:hypothetical protein HDU80_008301 [Chytriomyces hyalinus]